jgi:propionyl-CoA carboxylase alpha chain
MEFRIDKVAARPNSILFIIAFGIGKKIMKEIKKILIVNRGEIVGRISRTSRRMGIQTVSIYSEIDENSLHSFVTDESIELNGKLSRDTYLDFNKILNAVRISGADAVHPGFGFVSENAEFVDFMYKNGIKFIGPNSNSMRSMGDKIQSKILAKKAGVNVIPGLIEPIDDVELGLKVANDIGYPVILKAASGGGGKGIRIVWHDREMKDNFSLVVSEAQNSFGDGRVFIEKYIDNPRHIEIQILGDKHGNVVFLGERECSIQRRYQKIIEEAPSPFFENLGEKGMRIREEMGMQSVRLAKELGYYSAGTVEFVVDSKGHFYFLEVNTRLQVEHPVTEEIIRIKDRNGDYKIDLVEWMIRVENGEELSFTQSDIYFKGHSVEARVYAESPELGFMPSSGKVIEYFIPEMQNLRVESGIRKGSEVSVYYDPMLVKICVYGANRHEAIENIKSALAQTVIYGHSLKTNINFLEQIIRLPEFEYGDFSTNFIKQKYGDKFSLMLSQKQKDLYLKFIIANALIVLNDKKFLSIYGVNFNEEISLDVLNGTDNYYHVNIVKLKKESNVFHIISIDGKKISKIYKILNIENNILHFGMIDSKNKINKDYYFKFYPDGMNFILENSGYYLKMKAYPEMYGEFYDKIKDNKKSDDLNEKFVLSPLPGLVIGLNVEEGDVVVVNTNLLVIEAMKMQNVIYSVKVGKIKKIFVQERDIVQSDQKLIEFE